MIKISKNDKSAIISEQGGELLALYQGEKNLLWGRDPAVWESSAPLLFPICGRLRDNTYYHKGKTYTLTPHGFAKRMLYQITQQTDDSVRLTIRDNDETFKSYPFSFEFSVTYTLTEQGLQVDFTVSNHSQEPLPYSLGGHWGFALSESIEGYSLRFDAPVSLSREILDGAYISGEKEMLDVQGDTLPLSYHICDNDTWVIRNAPPACTLLLEGREVVRLEYPDSPHLLIWTKPQARFVCLEPWNGMPDGDKCTEITQKDSIHLLAPTQEQKFTHKIIF